MRRQIPAVRILPMSTRTPGFRDRSIADVQSRLFLRAVPANGGRFRYWTTGLNADPGTVVLFQFRARIIASAVFLRDEKYERPVEGHAGALYFDVRSIRTFDPVDVDAIRQAWPRFRAFGHVKQFLNPAGYPAFEKRLKNVQSPTL